MNSKVLINLILIVAILFLFNIGVDSTFSDGLPIQHITYDPTDNIFGPDAWGYTCKIGQKQSPIFGYATSGNTIPGDNNKAKFQNPATLNILPDKIIEVHNGYGVYFEFQYLFPPQTPKITGGPLGSSFYLFHSFGYHIGGEHQSGFRNGKIELELQFIFYKSEYKTFCNAQTKCDGLAIISVCYRTIKPSNKIFNPKLLSALDNATPPVTVLLGSNRFSLGQALDFTDMPSHHYYYEGSLTVPPCTENVKWFIIDNGDRVSKKDFDKFKSAMSPVVKNDRPIQKLGTRKVVEYQ